MIRNTQARSIALTTLFVLSVVWSAGALVGDVAAVGNTAGDGDADTRASATAVTPPQSVNATIESPDDADWYRTTVGEDNLLYVEMYAAEPPGAETTVRTTVGIYNEDGELVEEEYVTLNEYTVSVAAQDLDNGTYYVKVSSTWDTEEYDGAAPYELQFETTARDPNEADEPTAIESGETVSGNIVRSDGDAYTFDVEEGDEVTLEITPTGGINVAEDPGYVGVFVDAPGNATDPFGSSTEDGLASLGEGQTVTFTAETSGTYTLELFQPFAGYRAQPDEVTQYNVSLAVDEPADVDEEASPDMNDDGTDDTDNKTTMPDVDDGC